MRKKKIFVKPKTVGKKRTEEDRDRLLVQAATRAITQAAKKVRSFEAQQVTRTLKQRRERILKQGAGDQQAKVAELEAKATEDLARIRKLDLRDAILPQALAKLGLKPLDASDIGRKKIFRGGKPEAPKQAKEKVAMSNIGDSDDESGSSSEEPSEGATTCSDAATPVMDSAMEALVGRMLKHTSLVNAIESMDERVTQRRREKLAIAEGQPVPRKPKVAKQAVDAVYGGTSDGPSVNHRNSRTTFLTSLSGNAEEDAMTPDSDDEGDCEATKPKNRPGQRARQARHELNEKRKEAKQRAKEMKEGASSGPPLAAPPSGPLSHLSAQGTRMGRGKVSALRPGGVRPVAGQSAVDAGVYGGGVGGGHGSGHGSKKRPRDDATYASKPIGAKKSKAANAIHGSWEAAKLRREKEAATMFAPSQGKKIKFGDDGSVAQVVAAAPQAAPSATCRAPAAPAVSAEQNHPSWAAKQAQKALAAGGFQGKKITFD